jgi:hypothetical protein
MVQNKLPPLKGHAKRSRACLVVPLQGEYSVIPVTPERCPGLLCEVRFQRGFVLPVQGECFLIPATKGGCPGLLSDLRFRRTKLMRKAEERSYDNSRE